MTKSERKRASPVMMSSVIPSLKYVSSGWPLRLSKGSTAIDGLSGKGSGADAAEVGALDQRQTRTGCAMFFSVRSPVSSKAKSVLPANCFCTASAMQIPPGSASASSRAAMLTPSPSRSSPSTTTSPTLMPMRNTMRLLGRDLLLMDR